MDVPCLLRGCFRSRRVSFRSTLRGGLGGTLLAGCPAVRVSSSPTSHETFFFTHFFFLIRARITSKGARLRCTRGVCVHVSLVNLSDVHVSSVYSSDAHVSLVYSLDWQAFNRGITRGLRDSFTTIVGRGLVGEKRVKQRVLSSE